MLVMAYLHFLSFFLSLGRLGLALKAFCISSLVTFIHLRTERISRLSTLSKDLNSLAEELLLTHIPVLLQVYSFSF
ncbi:hypothetical protein CLU79DRAFT_755151 [Phycomyces nitens]|nr:hypothetical protein CLU79DRAFT_755151 [Phycomyces nitens]